MKKILTLLKYGVGFLLRPILYILPKDKKIWVFGAWFGKRYSDNPKYMYEYCVEKTDIKPYWIVKDRTLCTKLLSNGVNAVYYHSLFGIWIQMRASVAFVGHSISSDLASTFISPNCIRIQLWHGFPFKKIGFDDDKFNRLNRLGKVAAILFNYIINDRYTMAVSSGELCTKRFSSAFYLDVSKVIPLGFPRNDIFHEVCKTQKKIIYMPTFRGDFNSYFNAISNSEIIKINAYLSNCSMNLVIRLHPANRISDDMLFTIENCTNITFDNSEDIYETINTYDALITDFSSIMFDFSITGKPIIFDLTGAESYLKNDRGVYPNSHYHSTYPSFDSWDKLPSIFDCEFFGSNKYESDVLRSCVEENLKPGACERVYIMVKNIGEI